MFCVQYNIHFNSVVWTLVFNTILLLIFFACICLKEKDLVKGVIGWIKKRMGRN
jgi:hypothetical protein